MHGATAVYQDKHGYMFECMSVNVLTRSMLVQILFHTGLKTLKFAPSTLLLDVTVLRLVAVVARAYSRTKVSLRTIKR